MVMSFCPLLILQTTWKHISFAYQKVETHQPAVSYLPVSRGSSAYCLVNRRRLSAAASMAQAWQFACCTLSAASCQYACKHTSSLLLQRRLACFWDSRGGRYRCLDWQLVALAAGFQPPVWYGVREIIACQDERYDVLGVPDAS